jgi:hypothetical protein
MNERIKELVKQAGGHISIRNLASNPVQHIESVELWDDRIEKFAELIVRECAQSVTWYTKQERNWPNNGQVLRANKTVLEHFGVEE